MWAVTLGKAPFSVVHMSTRENSSLQESLRLTQSIVNQVQGAETIKKLAILALSVVRVLVPSAFVAELNSTVPDAHRRRTNNISAARRRAPGTRTTTCPCARGANRASNRRKASTYRTRRTTSTHHTSRSHRTTRTNTNSSTKASMLATARPARPPPTAPAPPHTHTTGTKTNSRTPASTLALSPAHPVPPTPTVIHTRLPSTWPRAPAAAILHTAFASRPVQVRCPPPQTPPHSPSLALLPIFWFSLSRLSFSLVQFCSPA